MDQLTHAEQEYVRRAEEKVLQLELGTTSDGRPGVHVLGGKSKEVVIPTTEELSAYVHDQEALAQIKSLRASAMQQADEKVAIADQTHSIIDATVERLDSDIAVLEKYVHYSSDCISVTTLLISHQSCLYSCFALQHVKGKLLVTCWFDPFLGSHPQTRFQSLFHRGRASFKMPGAESPMTWQPFRSTQLHRNGFLPRSFHTTLLQACILFPTKTRKATRVSVVV